MNTLDLILWIVLILATFSIITFSRRLHALAWQMQDSVERDKIQQDRLEATIDRMEQATVVVAENLADSISRADAVDGGEPGSAADAALRTGE